MTLGLNRDAWEAGKDIIARRRSFDYHRGEISNYIASGRYLLELAGVVFVSLVIPDHERITTPPTAAEPEEIEYTDGPLVDPAFRQLLP